MSDDIGKICLSWWAKLTSVNNSAMRADLARLRRADGVLSGLAVSAMHDLNSSLYAAGHGLKNQPERLALIALLLAQVKTSTQDSAARRMGGNPPALSGIRFTALIRTTDPAVLIVPMRRALRVIGQGANVARLATDLYWWNDATRARWCFDYYGASAVAPEEKQETEA